jgi:hypothetical protein
MLKRMFGHQTGRSVKLRRTNLAQLLVAECAKTHRNAGDIMGLNPAVADIPEFGALLDALAERYAIRPLPSLCTAAEIQKFESAAFPPLFLSGMFGTEIRTRSLVALNALGGSYDIGKLQRSVLGKFSGRVRVAVQGLIEEKILTKTGATVQFNPEFLCLSELRNLLVALERRMPEVAANAAARHAARWSRVGTAHPDGATFRLVGTRAAQAALAHLAANGPSQVTKILASAACTNSNTLEKLIVKGVVCKVRAYPGTRSEWRFSLNASYPVYRELRALLRTQAIQKESFPGWMPTEMYEGLDFSEPRLDFDPNPLFGRLSRHRTASVADVLATLVHTEHEECEPSALANILGEHEEMGIRDVLRRLERHGVLVSRKWKKMLLYRLNPRYGAYSELRDLLLAMGREWPWFREDGESEKAMRCGHRVAMERDRKPRRVPGPLQRSVNGVT